jgi:hypothetical protein
MYRRKKTLFTIVSLVFIIVFFSFIINIPSEKNTLQQVVSTQQTTNQLVSLLASHEVQASCPEKNECCRKGTTLNEPIYFYCKPPRAPMYLMWGSCKYLCSVDDDSCDNGGVSFKVGEGGAVTPGEPPNRLNIPTQQIGAMYGPPTFKGECPVVVY